LSARDQHGEPQGDTNRPFVGRGGLKLQHALSEFGIDPRGWVCADFGCNVGGFTDCLLRAGAARVYALDTGYGALAYTLRIDPRVVAMERTNALHADPPAEGPVDLVVMDLAWTPQRLCIPAALRWLRAGGRMISLVKPHYEATHGPEKGELVGGVLPEAAALATLDRVLAEFPALGVRMLGVTRSPILGGAGKKRASGNIEFLALLEPAAGAAAAGR
jgi:23S rRNA (cytidine1920-2'-O)/16S rRNA (cytidine1409-2'-O)-methyltransferase